jgi:hypothetical protein
MRIDAQSFEPDAFLELLFFELFDELSLEDDESELSELVLSDAPPPSFFFDEGEAYRSEYQPPPLRMNPVPAEICRFAFIFLQDGHFLRGSSLMDCCASHSCPHASQAYSYVGMSYSFVRMARSAVNRGRPLDFAGVRDRYRIFKLAIACNT